jgi:hypothetical protein
LKLTSLALSTASTITRNWQKLRASRGDILVAHSGFDEIYNWQLAEKLADTDNIAPVLNRLLKLAGVSF